MPDRPWKRRERQAAAAFGTRRKPGSGSQGHADETRSDTKHPRLFIESKARARSFVRTLMAAVAAQARKEGKLPVLALAETGKPGIIWCVREQDLYAFAVEYLAANYRPETTNDVLRAQKRLLGVDEGDF